MPVSPPASQPADPLLQQQHQTRFWCVLVDQYSRPSAAGHQLPGQRPDTISPPLQIPTDGGMLGRQHRQLQPCHQVQSEHRQIRPGLVRAERFRGQSIALWYLSGRKNKIVCNGNANSLPKSSLQKWQNCSWKCMCARIQGLPTARHQRITEFSKPSF